MNKLMYRFVATRKKKNKMPATLALRVMLGLNHLFQLYASPIDSLSPDDRVTLFPLYYATQTFTGSF